MPDVVLTYVELARDVALTAGPWMIYNSVLAAIPLLLAVGLFHGERPRRTAGWWAGVVAFVLFLPNAPYLVTDVIHLRGLLANHPGTRTSVIVPAGALAALIAFGVVVYAASLALVDRELRRSPVLARHRVLARSVLHLLCAFGVVLGRLPRLNSWDVVARPTTLVDGVLAVLDPRVVPLVLALAVVFALSAAAVTAVARAAWTRTLGVAETARRWMLTPAP
jgi:uncharacterized membrane protein